jgi:hypothetical protein
MPGLRFYFDEDSLDRAVVRALRRQGVDILTAGEAGMIRRPDGDQFALAIEAGRVLYTANVADFARIHARHLADGGSHPGVVVRTWQLMPVGVQIGALAALNAARSHSEVRDRLLYLSDFVE